MDTWYKVMLLNNGTIGVACVQWFDHMEFDHERFIGERQFEDEESAQAVADNLTLLLGPTLTKAHVRTLRQVITELA